ncbi:hypothetical protein HPT25_16535 [Bacillus sp. BRMEA1]|uniref:hypothetical protein n=1 Tax=Neobacillus endophyticus TaxID=2738405 RepID=UPI00156592AD|nr:hypothetical protein [Neobacillus endophyticus]NRD78973.1 hypothetical protein [Neobacillus endophyticus]
MLDSRNEPDWTNQRYQRERSARNCDCNEINQPNEGCCSRSRLRDEGIKRTNIPRVYFADADLECGGDCVGHDNEIIYEWSIYPEEPGSNVYIIGSSRKVGNDRVEVGGTGSFFLRVRVTFRCRLYDFELPVFRYVDCIREAAVHFNQ